MATKGTDTFKTAIQTYLEYRASTDELFAERYTNPKKNINDCITYILNEVKNSGCNGFDDDEIYSMAMHYYDEDDIKVGNPLNCKVIVNHPIELTEEEKQEARRKAIQRYQEEEYQKVKSRSNKARENKNTIEQPSLFNF